MNNFAFVIGFSYSKRGSDKEEHAIEANRQGPTLGMRHGPAALRRTARTTKRAAISATAPPSQATQARRRTNRHGGTGCAIEATCENAPQSGKSPRALRFAPPRPYCGICRRIASTYAAPYTERCVPLRVTSPTSIYSSISSGTEIIDAPLSSALITPEHTV